MVKFVHLKNVKNTHAAVLLSAKFQALTCNFTQSNSGFLNCTNGTKSRKASQLKTGCKKWCTLYLQAYALVNLYSTTLDFSV